MINVYVNIVNPHIEVHGNKTCGKVMQHKGHTKQHFTIDENTIGDELKRFKNDKYELKNAKGLRGMWLTIDFGDYEFEKALMKHIAKYIGDRYPTLYGAELKIDC